MNDVLAIAAATAGALSLTWAAFEVHGYLGRRRRQGAARAPGYGRMRIAVFGALATVGAVLGLALGAWILR